MTTNDQTMTNQVVHQRKMKEYLQSQRLQQSSQLQCNEGVCIASEKVENNQLMQIVITNHRSPITNHQSSAANLQKD